MVGSHGERAPEGRRLARARSHILCALFQKILLQSCLFQNLAAILEPSVVSKLLRERMALRRPPSSLRSRRPSRAEPAMVWLDGTVQPVVTHLTGGSPNARAIHLFNWLP